jgi:hypothetical protein
MGKTAEKCQNVGGCRFPGDGVGGCRCARQTRVTQSEKRFYCILRHTSANHYGLPQHTSRSSFGQPLQQNAAGFGIYYSKPRQVPAGSSRSPAGLQQVPGSPITLQRPRRPAYLRHTTPSISQQILHLASGHPSAALDLGSLQRASADSATHQHSFTI